MARETRIERIRTQATAVVRYTADIDNLGPPMGQALLTVWKHLEENGIPAVGKPFTRYLSTHGDHFHLESGFSVPGPIAGDKQVGAGELPGGPVARALHVGPYEQLGDTHTAVLGWISEQGHAPGGPIWEVYLTDPNQVEDPADYQTEIFCPLG